jgi:hypothetical protein
MKSHAKARVIYLTKDEGLLRINLHRQVRWRSHCDPLKDPSNVKQNVRQFTFKYSLIDQMLSIHTQIEAPNRSADIDFNFRGILHKNTPEDRTFDPSRLRVSRHCEVPGVEYYYLSSAVSLGALSSVHGVSKVKLCTGSPSKSKLAILGQDLRNGSKHCAIAMLRLGNGQR